MIRAKKLIFQNFKTHQNTHFFSFLIDEKEINVSLAHNANYALGSKQLQTALFNIGMCYLIDLAEILIPSEVFINFSLTHLQLEFWRVLYQEVAKEKCCIENIDLKLLDSEWKSNEEGKNFGLISLSSNRKKVALCLTGGKESLTALKLLKNKKDLLLFFLNPETSIHRQKVYDRVKNELPTIKTISNRFELFSKIKKEHQTDLGSGVDMAHLVFNCLLFGPEYVLIGNEYSSNFPNKIYQGYMINHQYVKSIYFAQKLNSYIRSFVASDYSYNSPFFGLYEIKIASALFKTDEYLEVWTSCNKTTSEINFCSNCAKCGFTYLVSLLYSNEEFLARFFSTDMLCNIELFKPLMDFTAEKPLDCVGEKIEVWVALDQLSKNDLYATKPVIKYFKQNIFPFIERDLTRFSEEVNSWQKIPVELPGDLQIILNEAYEIL